MPDSAIRVLFIDDSDDDVLLAATRVRRLFPRARCERVDTVESLRAALESRPWDAVVSDLTLPRLDAAAALAMVRSAQPGVPFILFYAPRGPRAAADAGAVAANATVPKLECELLAEVIANQVRDARPTRSVPAPRDREAVAAASLALLAHPVAALGNGRPWGVELRVRRRDERGTPGPVDLEAPLDGGGAETVGDWLLEQAIEAANAVRGRGRRDLRIAVQAPRSLISAPDSVRNILARLAAGGAPPDSLEVAMPEAWVLADPRGAHRAADALKRAGIGVALDDFGSTYGPLAPLQAVAPDTLGLSATLVRESRGAASCEAALEGAVALARALGARVLAAGVESASHAARLAKLGVDRASGPYLPAVALGSAAEVMPMEGVVAKDEGLFRRSGHR